MDERLRLVARLLDGENDRTAPTGFSAAHSALIPLSVTPMFASERNPGAGPGLLEPLAQVKLWQERINEIQVRLLIYAIASTDTGAVAIQTVGRHGDDCV